IQRVVTGVKDGTYENAMDAAHALDMKPQYSTIRRHLLEKTKPQVHAHLHQQLLTCIQERILCNWIKYLGYASIPLSKKTISLKVQALCGRTPSCCWVHRFLH
ncbi:hypothetical protein OF83DRAFT_1068739, partial [Amylostereum chailletii]